MSFKKDISKLKEVYRSKKMAAGRKYALLATLEKIRDVYEARSGIRIALPFSTSEPKGNQWLHEAVEISILNELSYALTPLPISVDEKSDKTINFLLPTLDPQIIFGGYISILNFIRKVRENNYRVRIILCDYFNDKITVDRITSGLESHKLLSSCLGQDTEIIFGRNVKDIRVSSQDSFVAYSWVTAYAAHNASLCTNGRPFTFYIQEFEPIFYANDSFRAAAEGSYSLPHYPIFNSELLKIYFENNHLGVFSPSAKNKKFDFYSHAISDIKAPSLQELESRKRKRLIFYARPEAHASRNIFAVGILALRDAVQRGVFDDSWDFFGIGSMSFKEPVALSNKKYLQVVPRMSLQEYQNTLGDFDLGMALMYAPHPSVPPLEMAAGCMPTVTTCYSNRPVEAMKSISANLIPAESNPLALSHALKIAVQKVGNFEERIKNSKYDWPRNWDESFNDSFVNRITKNIHNC